MKVRDLSKKYGINGDAFTTWIRTTDYKFSVGAMGGVNVEDSQDIDAIVASFKQFENETREAEQAEAQARELAAQQKTQALANMLITSGFNFDGYTITKYSGYISGDDAVSVARPTHGYWGSVRGNVGGELLEALVQIRRNAIAELKEAAYALGCNAVIGVDFDYLTLDPETATNQGGTLYLPFLFAVTANGNAVVIERNQS